MADVCLMLEGTYPYIAGGVSSWVHQLISKLPNTSFQLVFIGARSEDRLVAQYKMPMNVVGLQEVFLFDDVKETTPGKIELSNTELEALMILHREFHEKDPGGHSLKDLRYSKFKDAMLTLFPPSRTDSLLLSSLGSKGIWRQIQKEYRLAGTELPFISFFYTWRSMHLPIYRILSTKYPKATVYHSLCTGYAGLAATQAAISHDARSLITEHGIYAHERAIEISQSDWIYERQGDLETLDDPTDHFKRWWINTFRNMSRIAYGTASETITLYELNRKKQISDGAIPERLSIVPNGITSKLTAIRRKNPSWKGMQSGPSQPIFKIGFVGRVVSIKDVKMLIKAIRAVYDEFPHIECQIIGPNEEEPEYALQCRELTTFLGLDKIVHFVGKKDVNEVYPLLDCVIITSISEAQPLVVLEANLAGIPVVSTRVGSVPELLEGVSEPDRLLGPSGLISEIGDSEQTGAQILKLIQEPELWEKMSLAGIERVVGFYSESDMIARYDLLYRKHMSGKWQE